MEIKKITRHAKQQFRRRYRYYTSHLYIWLAFGSLSPVFDAIYQVDFRDEKFYPVINKEGVMLTVLSPEIVACKIRHYDYELEARRYIRRPLVKSSTYTGQGCVSVVGC